MERLEEFITYKLANGAYFFTKQEALKTLGISPDQFRHQAYRLSIKKVLMRLIGGFYMIIPAEYYHQGSLPPLWIIDQLMGYLDQPYYVGLLSAAALYGSTEQQPMTFQVITNKLTRAIDLERGLITFHTFSECKKSHVIKHKVPTGYVFISSKTQTMVDLIRYHQASGYMSNVAIVIKNIAAECNLDDFKEEIKGERTGPILQRLGYILALQGLSNFALVVEEELSKRSTRYVLLEPDSHSKSGKKYNDGS